MENIPTTDELKELRKTQLPGGGTRSEIKPSYDLIPFEGPERTAKRSAYGAKIHGRENWKKSILSSEADAALFCQDAFNHMLEHAIKMANKIELHDDHLGAIGWAQAVLCFAEASYHKPWTYLGVENDHEPLARQVQRG